MATDTYTKVAQEAQEQTLSAIRQAQDASLKIASVGWEQAEQLPTPAQAIESAFDFAGRVLELQKQYALRLAGVAAKPGSASRG
jgi:hypothetical protein